MHPSFSHLGRQPKIKHHSDRLIRLLLYYRAYVTHEFIGYLVGLDATNVGRLFDRIEPLVAQHIHIKKDRTLTKDQVLCLLVDVNEQPIQRPKDKKNRKKYYSGKKKRPTHQVEIAMSSQGQIMNISKTHPGRVHAIQIRRSSDPLPPDAIK